MSGQTFIFALVSLVLLVIVLVLRRQRERGLQAFRNAVDEIASIGSLRGMDGETGRREDGTTARMGLDELSDRMREMGRGLADELRDLRQDRGLLQAILTSMTQSVIALDTEERVLSLNSAACELLDTNRDWAVGRSIQEILRSPALQEFVRSTITNSGSHTEKSYHYL